MTSPEAAGARALARAREAVRASLSDGESGPPQPVHSRNPIAPLPERVEQKLARRSAATTTGRRGRGVSRRDLVRVAAMVVIDAALLVVAIVLGNIPFIVIFAVLLVALLVLAGRGVRGSNATAATTLTERDLRDVEAASRWEPKQPWDTASTTSPAAALARAATRAAQRIVDSPPWVSGELNRAGVTVGLAAELDLVEERCFVMATASDPVESGLWDETFTRVAALTAYADTATDEGADGVDRDALRYLLSAAIFDPVDDAG